MVTAEDGVTANIYMVSVTRADPNSIDDATLSALTLEESAGDAVQFTPAFDRATGDYSATVAYDVDAVQVVATRNHGGAAVQIIEEDGTTTTADAATVSLDYGENLVKAMVTAETALPSRSTGSPSPEPYRGPPR